MLNESGAKERENRLRNVAVQIVGQLPNSPEEKLLALQYARELVEAFFGSEGRSGVRLHSIRAAQDLTKMD